jgi:hypothetical protein
MSITTFEDAKVGDKVYSPTFGWGEIVCTNGFEHYPLEVRFQNVDIDTHYFTLEGYYYEDTPIQSLFWTEMKVVPLIKPTATKLVNGVEIPDISFIPDLNEHYYTPYPLHPTLYDRTFYCGVESDKFIIRNGMCYPDTEEGKAAAILHAKAMLGIC